MKTLILTLTAIGAIGFSASTFAQSQLTVDNFNGTGGPTAANHGLFFNGDGTPATIATLNASLSGGANASSLQAIGSFVGAGALVNAGVPGIYLDPLVKTYDVPGVTAGGLATLSLQVWKGSATSYAQAAAEDRGYAPGGVDLSAFTFTTATGGAGVPPAPAASAFDGMPAMTVGAIPEPSTLALAGLGAAALLMYRRRTA